jgi:hypothetical protein
VLFFGRAVYSDSLPRYYTFFLTAITTPETILALTLIGVVVLFRDRARRATLALFGVNALFILFLGSLPGAVLHDGMRQMLSVYAFMAALAGAGFHRLAQTLGRRVARVKALESIRNVQAKATLALAVLLLAPPLITVIAYHPFELSYYNRFVGGLAGAYARGLEPTYFMEAITPSFLNYLNEKLPQNARVNGLFANFMLEYYQQQGKLRRDIKIANSEPFDYTLVLNRRSVLGTIATRRQLDHLKNGRQPLASVSLGGVPLVMLYEAHPR